MPFAPGTCCWRHCKRKATELDLAPEFGFCAFHRECVAWEMLLDYLGVVVPRGTPPFQYRFLLMKRLKELQRLSDEEAKALIMKIAYDMGI